MDTIQLSLVIDPEFDPFGIITINPRMSWLEVSQLIRDAARNARFGHFQTMYYHNNDKSCSNEYEWQEFVDHCADCPRCANKDTLEVRCEFSCNMTYEVATIGGLQGTITVPKYVRDGLLYHTLVSRLAEQYGRGRTVAKILYGVNIVYSSFEGQVLTNEEAYRRNADSWFAFQETLRTLPGDRPPRLTVYFSEDRTVVTDYIRNLEEDLGKNPPKNEAIDKYLEGEYRCVHADEALLRLFIAQFKKVLLSLGPEDVAKRYKDLDRIYSLPSRHRVKMALVDVAYTQSEGRSFATSPKDWQEQVSTDELWRLLDNNLISYQDVPPNMRLYLKDEDRLLKHIDLHPDMIQFVPFRLLLTNETLLALRLMVEPSLYYTKLPEEMRLRSSLIEAFLESTNPMSDEVGHKECPWCFKYSKLPAEIRETGGLDLASRCLHRKRLQVDQEDARDTKRRKTLSEKFL